MPENIYQELQKLKEFVAFVGSIEIASAEQRENAKEIIQLIETLNQPKTYKNWMVDISLLDLDKMDNSKRGVYLR